MPFVSASLISTSVAPAILGRFVCLPVSAEVCCDHDLLSRGTPAPCYVLVADLHAPLLLLLRLLLLLLLLPLPVLGLQLLLLL